MTIIRKKIVFAKLFNRYDHYSTEIRFELFRWMISTGWNYNVNHGVFEQLYGLSSINSQQFCGYYGFHTLDYDTEMQLAFVRAIISDDCSNLVKHWREDNGIGIDRTRYLNLRISDMNNSGLNELLYKLFESHKHKLAVQLNPCWREAINIDSVRLSPHPTGWVAIMEYGFDGSLWDHTLAKQGQGPFADFLVEACGELDRVCGKN